MSLHKHEPVSEGEMKVVSPRYSICECLRQCYWMTSDPNLKLKLREATAMAKAMGKKLSKNDIASLWDRNIGEGVTGEE